ncbi:MAG: hypothetical protein H6632_06000 [Anaerolineales bacterium]|nr:hypothetical protein [Anaerolineales bacterium]
MKKITFSLFAVMMLLGLVASSWAATALAGPSRPGQLSDKITAFLANRCEKDWNADINAAAADVYGLSAVDVVDGLHHGAVLKELAGNPAEVIKLQGQLVQIQSAKVDQAVAKGLITEEQAAKLKTALPFLANQLVEYGGGPYWGDGMAGGKRWGVWRDDVAAVLNMDVETLAAALYGGQSLGEVTEAQGVSVDEVVAILLTTADEKLAVAVDNGYINQEQADNAMAALEKNVTKLIYSTGPCSIDLGSLDLDDMPRLKQVVAAIASN